MSTSLGLRTVRSITLGLGCVHVLSTAGLAVEPWPYFRNGSVAEDKILATLDQVTRLEFVETPLTEVFDFLSQFHGIPFVFDAVGLEEMSIDPDIEAVSIELSDVTLRSGLIHLLRTQQLTYAVRNDVVLITSPQRKESLDLRAYNVKALVDQGVNAAELVKILQGASGASQITEQAENGYGSARGYGASTRARDSRKAGTGTFYLAARGSLIVVRAMDSQHREVARSIRTVYDAMVNKQPAERSRVATPTPQPRRQRFATPHSADDDPFLAEEDESDGLFGGFKEPNDNGKDDHEDPFGC